MLAVDSGAAHLLMEDVADGGRLRAQCRQAIPHVTHGQHAEGLSQPPGAPAIVHHRDDPRHVWRRLVRGGACVEEPPQDGREARTSAEGHDARATRAG
jgi:hypothetical protein